MTSSMTLETTATPTASKQIGCLPYQIFHIASFFASKDEAKYLITCIHLKVETKQGKKFIRIASTDGHRLFRFEFESNENPYWIDDEVKELLIDTSAFKKSIAKAERVIIYDNGFGEVWGKNIMSGSICGLRWKSKVEGTYPQVDQLIPDSFSNEPKKPMAFNPKYLADVFKLASKFSPNQTLRMYTNHPITPVIFRSKCNIEDLEESELEFLVMPIQIRY